MHSKKCCEENKTVMSHKLLGGQLAIAVEVKESFSDEVTVETQVCGNQPGIGMEETLQESSKHRDSEAEMNLVHLRFSEVVGLVGVI